MDKFVYLDFVVRENTNIQERPIAPIGGFVPHFISVLAPLIEVIKFGPCGVSLGKEQERAFELLKYKLTHVTILYYPNFSKFYEIEYDISSVGISTILMQEGRPVMHFNKNLNEATLSHPSLKQFYFIFIFLIYTFPFDFY